MKNNKRNNEIRVSKPKHKTKPSQTQQRNTQNVSSTTGRQGGTNRRTNGRKCTCNPAPLPATLAAPFSLSSETEKTFEIAYCRLLSEAAVSSAAWQLGVCSRSWSRRSRCRRQLDSRRALQWTHCAGIVCVGQRETSRLVELCAAIRSQSANTPGRGGAETAAKQVLAGETVAGRGGQQGSGKREPFGMFWSLYFSCGHLQTALKMGNDLPYSSFVHSAEHV